MESKVQEIVCTKEEGSEDTDGASLECIYHVVGVYLNFTSLICQVKSDLLED